MKIVVLMSTYNGERYVEAQVCSILSQLPQDGELRVRDDGSTDTTAALVEAIADARVRVTRGTNIGFARSFLHLLKAAPDDADVVMLSDQDDVWLPDKIRRASGALAAFEKKPALYCSRQKLVDEHLRPLGESPSWPRGPSFRNALVQNIATGCTIAINRRALLLSREFGDESSIHFHDWWLYLVVSAFGQVVADDEPSLLYRQHGRNAIGTGAGFFGHVAKLEFVRRTGWLDAMYQQTKNFLAVHGQRLSAPEKQFVERHLVRLPGPMLRLAFTPVRLRQTLVDEALFRALVLANIHRVYMGCHRSAA